MDSCGPLRNLDVLRDKLRTHADRVLLDHAQRFACRLGCDGCCQTERTVSDVEYAGLQRGWARLDDATRARLRAREGDGCPLLLDGGCALYDERPLICRSHGLPILMDGRRDVCPLNFTDLSIDLLDDTDILSVDTITAILVAVNGVYCSETDGDPHRRRPVSALFD